MIVKRERGQATLVCERKSPETADQPQTNAHFPLHVTLKRKKGFLGGVFIASLGEISKTCFLIPATITILSRFPVTFSLTFFDVGWVSEWRHRGVSLIWSAVQHLTTVTSSEKKHTTPHHSALPPTAAPHVKCVSLLWQTAVSGEAKRSPHHILSCSSCVSHMSNFLRHRYDRKPWPQGEGSHYHWLIREISLTLESDNNYNI